MSSTTFFYFQIKSRWSIINDHVHYDIYYFQINSWWSLIINHVHYDIFLFSNHWSLIMCIMTIFYFQIKSWWSLIINHVHYDIFLFSNQIMVVTDQWSCALRHFSIFKSNQGDHWSLIMCIMTFFYFQIKSWWSLIINHVHLYESC